MDCMPTPAFLLSTAASMMGYMMGAPVGRAELSPGAVAAIDADCMAAVEANDPVAFVGALSRLMLRGGAVAPAPPGDDGLRLPRASRAAAFSENPTYLLHLCERGLFAYGARPAPFDVTLYDMLMGCGHSHAEQINQLYTQRAAPPLAPADGPT